MNKKQTKDKKAAKEFKKFVKDISRIHSQVNEVVDYSLDIPFPGLKRQDYYK